MFDNLTEKEWIIFSFIIGYAMGAGGVLIVAWIMK